MTESGLRIKSICVYPIKSFQGCSPPSLVATPTGFNYDRRFMLQRVSDGKHMSIGKVFEMCLFTTELSPAENPNKVIVRYTQDHVFEKPDEKVEDEALEVPLEPQCKLDRLKEREYNMHGSPTIGYEMPDRYNEWFSKRFGYPVRFLYIGENRRQVLGNVTPNAKPLGENGNAKAGKGWFDVARDLVSSAAGYGENKENENAYKGLDEGIGFADVAPFLVISSKSYDDAAARLQQEELNIYKFRPNIIVEGAEEAFEEDYWAEIAVDGSDARIVLTSNCARCASLNVDFTTGKQGQTESGKILKLLQKDRRVDKGMKYSPIFGRYGFLAGKGSVQDAAEVEFKVGDPITVVRRNEERTRFQWPGISTDS